MAKHKSMLQVQAEVALLRKEYDQGHIAARIYRRQREQLMKRMRKIVAQESGKGR